MSTARQAGSQTPAREGGDTRVRLIEAAAREFRAGGYSGTDSNRIARRAGFAPQTFYRWFRDKLEIFLAVYRRWEDEEREALAPLMSQNASAPRAPRMVEAIVRHHRSWRIFRRSLRALSLEEPALRRARARSRLRQLEQIRLRVRAPQSRNSELAAILFEIERLADAVAEHELRDMDLDDTALRTELAALMRRLGDRRPAAGR